MVVYLADGRGTPGVDASLRNASFQISPIQADQRTLQPERLEQGASATVLIHHFVGIEKSGNPYCIEIQIEPLRFEIGVNLVAI